MPSSFSAIKGCHVSLRPFGYSEHSIRLYAVMQKWAEAQTHFKKGINMRKPKDTKYAFRINKQDLEQIKNIAKRSNLSTTDYITKVALKEKITVIDGFKEFSYEVRRLGNNLNQIAKLSHSGIVNQEHFMQTTQDFKSIITKLSKISEVIS